MDFPMIFPWITDPPHVFFPQKTTWPVEAPREVSRAWVVAGGTTCRGADAEGESSGPWQNIIRMFYDYILFVDIDNSYTYIYI